MALQTRDFHPGFENGIAVVTYLVVPVEFIRVHGTARIGAICCAAWPAEYKTLARIPPSLHMRFVWALRCKRNGVPDNIPRTARSVER